jgi:hypothetical protein
MVNPDKGKFYKMAKYKSEKEYFELVESIKNNEDEKALQILNRMATDGDL